MDAIRLMKRGEVTVKTVLHHFAVHPRQGQATTEAALDASVNRPQAKASYRRSSQ